MRGAQHVSPRDGEVQHSTTRRGEGAPSRVSKWQPLPRPHCADAHDLRPVCQVCRGCCARPCLGNTDCTETAAYPARRSAGALTETVRLRKSSSATHLQAIGGHIDRVCGHAHAAVRVRVAID